MCSRTSVNRLKTHYKDDDVDCKEDDDDCKDDDDDDENSLECEVALFCAALKAGHVAVHRHHVPEAHRRHVQGVCDIYELYFFWSVPE